MIKIVDLFIESLESANDSELEYIRFLLGIITPDQMTCRLTGRKGKCELKAYRIGSGYAKPLNGGYYDYDENILVLEDLAE